VPFGARILGFAVVLSMVWAGLLLHFAGENMWTLFGFLLVGGVQVVPVVIHNRRLTPTV
jgi:hypothetical protein